MLPLEGAVVQPGADNCDGNNHQRTVNYIVLLEAELIAPAQTVNCRQRKTDGDNQAIVVNLHKAQI